MCLPPEKKKERNIKKKDIKYNGPWQYESLVPYYQVSC